MPQSEWGDWHESLFGCCSDVRSCCCAMFCPCFLYAEINELVTGDSWCCSCLGFLLCAAFGCSVCQVSAQRRRVRLYYGIKEGCCCCDCLVICFFGCCAMAQERREIDARGAPKHQSMGGGGGITIVNAITNTNDNKSNSGGNTITGGNTTVDNAKQSHKSGPIQTFTQPASPTYAPQTEMYRSPQHAPQSPYPPPMQYASQPQHVYPPQAQPQYLPQYQPQYPQYPPQLYPAQVTTSETAPDPYAEAAQQTASGYAAPALPPRPSHTASTNRVG